MHAPVADTTDGRLIDETRSLFLLKRAQRDAGTSTWVRFGASMLAGSANPAIAAAAKRLGANEWGTMRGAARSLEQSDSNNVYWHSFRRG